MISAKISISKKNHPAVSNKLLWAFEDAHKRAVQQIGFQDTRAWKVGKSSIHGIKWSYDLADLQLMK
jgi:hypothetical protein